MVFRSNTETARSTSSPASSSHCPLRFSTLPWITFIYSRSFHSQAPFHCLQEHHPTRRLHPVFFPPTTLPLLLKAHYFWHTSKSPCYHLALLLPITSQIARHDYSCSLHSPPPSICLPKHRLPTSAPSSHPSVRLPEHHLPTRAPTKIPSRLRYHCRHCLHTFSKLPPRHHATFLRHYHPSSRWLPTVYPTFSQRPHLKPR
jgi:hypothetical protein